MRVIKTELFKYDELSEAAQEVARDWFRRASDSDTYTQDEIVESFKAVFKAAGLRLSAYSIGGYSYSSVDFDIGDAGDLKGKRAMAWLENNLFAGLRITAHEFNKNKKNYMRYGNEYRIGKVKPCALTGVCFDEELLHDLKSSVKDGMTLKDSFSALADKARQMIEEAYEWERKDEIVVKNIEANEYEFTEDGKRA